jgi:hypothetical protein
MTETDGKLPSILAKLAERLAVAAAERGLDCTPRPEFVSSCFRGSESDAMRMNPTDLPAAATGLSIGRHTLVLGLLPETPAFAAVRETIRRYRNQCVIARSYLSANAALDLQLIVAGPTGSEASREWEAMALMVERDDRVARKLAWLRPADPANEDESFTEFLGRSFLSRPWAGAPKVEPALLDQLSASDSAAVVPRDTAGQWEAIALRGEEDSFKTVDALVAAWAKRTTT